MLIIVFSASSGPASNYANCIFNYYMLIYYYFSALLLRMIKIIQAALSAEF